MQTFIMLAPVLAPLGAAFLIPFLSLISRRLLPYFCLLAMLVCITALVSAFSPVFQAGQILVYWMGGWKPTGGLAIGINLAIDGWGLLIAFTIALVALLVIIYSIDYMRQETGKEAYYVLIMLLTAALIGFTITGDLFNQFVWLEILSFASFALTAFHYQERFAIEGAFKYMITNVVAALFIVVALALLYAKTGALNLADAAGQFGRSTAEIIALGLLVAGYATKTGLVPWHFWLPDAYQAAPAPVTAFFSGAVSKVGIYAIGRILFTLTPLKFNIDVKPIFIAIAAITMFVGGFQMLRQDSLKRILAYSSISQMGYILMGLAIGTPLAIAAAAVHIFNHAMAKAALFFGAGSVRLHSGVSFLSEGGGLISSMPGTFVLMSLAGLSLSGMPLFIGFVSKSMLEEAAFHDNLPWLAGIAILASVFTFAGIARMLWRVFWEQAPEKASSRESQPQALAIFAMIVPVLLSIVIGVFPFRWLRTVAYPAAAALLQPNQYVSSILNISPQQPPNVAFVYERPPLLGDISSWIIITSVLLGGLLLTYYSLPHHEAYLWNFPPLRVFNSGIRRWHSGYLLDYVLWIAFSTSILLLLFVLIDIRVL